MPILCQEASDGSRFVNERHGLLTTVGAIQLPALVNRDDLDMNPAVRIVAAVLPFHRTGIQFIRSNFADDRVGKSGTSKRSANRVRIPLSGKDEKDSCFVSGALSNGSSSQVGTWCGSRGICVVDRCWGDFAACKLTYDCWREIAVTLINTRTG